MIINNNDILRRVRYIFDFSDQLMLSIFKLGGHEASKPELATWLAREEELEFVLCEDEKLVRFLNGLIIKNRGPKHKNYRKCLGQLLRNVLDGMEIHYRKNQARTPG